MSVLALTVCGYDIAYCIAVCHFCGIFISSDSWILDAEPCICSFIQLVFCNKHILFDFYLLIDTDDCFSVLKFKWFIETTVSISE